MSEIAVIRHAAADVDAYRASTEAANMCKDIVVACSSTIQGRRFVSVEGWSAIAVAHGCTLSARDVEKIDGGVRAVGDVRRMSDGQLIATGEGFVGEDETTWFGGKDRRGKVHEKRNDYAIRAMAQTRAMSRAGRTAFAHVVVMMKAGLATTPAEEMIAIDGETGEIIESGSGPAPRTKLEGPYTSKTALKNAIHAIAGSVGKAKSVDEIDAAVKAGKDAIKQAERDWPALLTGDPSLEGDDEGLKRMCARRRAELSRVDSAEFQFLASVIQECASATELSSILDEYASKIEALDGEESRRFEEIYNARETALKAEPDDMTRAYTQEELRQAASGGKTPLEAGAFGG